VQRHPTQTEGRHKSRATLAAMADTMVVEGDATDGVDGAELGAVGGVSTTSAPSLNSHPPSPFHTLLHSTSHRTTPYRRSGQCGSGQCRHRLQIKRSARAQGARAKGGHCIIHQRTGQFSDLLPLLPPLQSTLHCRHTQPHNNMVQH
jgi:hypothetical protein